MENKNALLAALVLY